MEYQTIIYQTPERKRILYRGKNSVDANEAMIVATNIISLFSLTADIKVLKIEPAKLVTSDSVLCERSFREGCLQQ